MQRDDRGKPLARDDGRHDLRGEPAVGLEHRVERRLVECGAAVGLDDLASPQQLAYHGLPTKSDCSLVRNGGNT